MDIDTTTVVPEVAGIIEAARIRWEQIIIGDLPAVNAGSLKTSCPNFPTEEIDDLYICASLTSIDGDSGILAVSGPSRVRIASPQLPTDGTMLFDSADVNRLITEGRFENVVLHEMGHIFGLGTLWKRFDLNNGEDSVYNGAFANAQFQALGCSNTVPIETDGGASTAFLHWDDVCLQNELMTGFLSAGDNPISSITIGGLQDLGYEVSYATADPFTSADLGGTCCNGSLVSGIKENNADMPKLLPETYNLAKAYVDDLRVKDEEASLSDGSFIVDDRYEVVVEQNGTIFFVLVH